jgi:hypothetical protein
MTICKNIEFDEINLALDILKNGFSKGYLTIRELTLLAKYYYDLGKTGNKLKKELIDFCKEHSVGFNEIVHRQTIINAIKKAEKYNLKLSNYVGITISEMNIIRSLPMKYAKVLFVMIVVAKYNKNNPIKKKENYKADNNKFYCNKNMREILGIARITMCEDEVLKMCQFLAKENKYIKPIEEHDDSYEVIFIDNDFDIEIVVEDMGKIVDFFPYYCEKCKKEMDKSEKAKKHNLCKECYEEKRKETIRNNAREYWRKNHT